MRSILIASSSLSIGIAWALIASFRDDQRVSGQWGCEMSWMTPSYRLIDWKERPIARYKLYLYREQGWDESGEPSGSPVIFIPGNAGSYQQVRSIASAAARRREEHAWGAEAAGPAGGLDFFTVDFNEEFSAFRAQTIRDQAEFVAAAIDRISTTYGTAKPVVLVGHSMGGIVARLASASQQESQIRAIVTLSTPHAFPIVPLDAQFEAIYRTIHSRSGYLPILSICGGVSDIEIAAEACRLESADPDLALTIMTSAIAGAWTSVDHQAIVWCHQIRWTIAELLLKTAFDSSQFLANAKDLLLGSGLLRASQAGPAIELEHVPGHDITVSIKGTNEINLPSGTRISACSAASCRDRSFSPSAYPHMIDPTTPFPNPGEGTSPADIAHVLELTDRESSVGASLKIEGLPVGAKATMGRRCTDTVAGTTWKAELGRSCLHQVLHFPSVRVSSLMVWKMEIRASRCSDRPATIKVSLPDLLPTLIDARYYVGREGAIRIHGHLASAPFLGSGRVSVRVDLIQEDPCSIDYVRLRYSWWESLGKLALRIRSGALAWTLAWISVMMATAGFHNMPLLPAAFETIARSWLIMLGLGTVVFIQAAFPALGRHLLLGTTDISDLVPVMITAVGTLSLASLVIAIAQAILLFCQRRKGVSRHPRANSSAVLAGLCVLVGLGFPHDPAAAILIVARALQACGEDNTTDRYTGVAFALLLLPFHAAGSLPWPRILLADPTARETGLWPVIKILPLVLMMGRSQVVNGSSTYQQPSQLTQWVLVTFALVAGLLGPRHAYLIPGVAQGVYLTFACT